LVDPAHQGSPGRPNDLGGAGPGPRSSAVRPGPLAGSDPLRHRTLAGATADPERGSIPAGEGVGRQRSPRVRSSRARRRRHRRNAPAGERKKTTAGCPWRRPAVVRWEG